MQAIYPTLIIILVALGKSEIEKQSQLFARAIPLSMPSIVDLSSVQVDVTTVAAASGDGTGGHTVDLACPQLQLMELPRLSLSMSNISGGVVCVKKGSQESL